MKSFAWCLLLTLVGFHAVAQDQNTDDDKEVRVKIIVEDGTNNDQTGETTIQKVEKVNDGNVQEVQVEDGKIIIDKDKVEIKEVSEEMEMKMEETKETNFPEFNLPPFDVVEEDKSMSEGVQIGQSVYIPDAFPKDVAELWQDKMKDYKASRKISKNSKVYKMNNDGEVRATDMMMPSISNELINVYATFVPDGTGVKVTSFYELGEGEFLTHDDNQSGYQVSERILKDFGKQAMRMSVEQELATEEKTLKKIDAEQKKLIQQNASMHKSIERNEALIEKAKMDIEQAKLDIDQNLIDQENKIAEADAQKKFLQYVKEKLSKF